MIVPGGVDRTGTERVIPVLLWLIERLARETELHVFALRQEPRPARYDLLGAHIHNIGARPRRARTIAAIVAEHSHAPFDVLHAVWAAPPGAIAAVAGALLRRPVLLGLTGGDLASVPDIRYGVLHTRRGRVWLRLALAGATRITVPSLAMQAAARARGIEAQCVQLGVALDRWPPMAVRPRAPHERARLLHVASLNRVKDQRTLLLAVKQLTQAGLDFTLDIVGVDTLDGEMQTLAAGLSIDERVTFHGFLTQTALRPFFERAHLLVISSRHEADPIVTLEAAVAGVPTVGTAVGHIADWNGVASVAVPVADPAALSRAILELLADEPRRQRIAAAAQSRACTFNADWSAHQVGQIYRQMIAPRPP
jgi:glycosyltransferase involved in cell wall biosynthesis